MSDPVYDRLFEDLRAGIPVPPVPGYITPAIAAAPADPETPESSRIEPEPETGAGVQKEEPVTETKPGISPKVAAASAGAGVGAAIVGIAAWIASLNGLAVPPEVQGYGTIVVSAGIAWIAGWATRDDRSPRP